MANAVNKEALQSVGGTDVYGTLAELLHIAEEDPTHPLHHEHMERVRIDKPEMQVLINSFREFGWQSPLPIAAWKDGCGKEARYVVCEGRRRLVAVRAENARRLKEKDPRGPIRPLVVLDKGDPVLTTVRSNEMREGDPPMVRARRYVELRATMGAAKAAAAIGETLATANQLAQILGLPDVELHEAVNTKALPIDVAHRAVKGGSAAVAKVKEAMRGKTGKAKTEAAKKTVKKVVEPRARAKNANVIKAVAEHLREAGGNVKVVSALVWAAGSCDEDPPEWLQKAIDAAKEAE